MFSAAILHPPPFTPYFSLLRRDYTSSAVITRKHSRDAADEKGHQPIVDRHHQASRTLRRCGGQIADAQFGICILPLF